MLQAAAHLQKKNGSLVSKLFPVRIPRTLTSTSKRMAKALRQQALQAREQKTPAKNETE
jgi:hypothetical protein